MTVALPQKRLSEAIDRLYAAMDARQPIDRQELLLEYADIADELNDCLQNLDFIEQIGPQLAENAAGESAEIENAAKRRAHLGDFRILREVGRGGMGVVYEAEQLSLGRRVALKVLPFAAMLDRQQLARFKNEARAAATLDHPNIVAIHSVGVERGVHYYAMQLIEGQSLADVIACMKTGRPPSEEKTLALPPLPLGEGRGEGITHHNSAADDTVKAALPTACNGSAAFSSIPQFASRDYFRTIAQLGIQAAEALDHAHQNGVLHRDIKPANLLVEFKTPSPLGGGPGRGSGNGSHLKLWIADFGLARIEQDACMTMTGDLLGTLRYMSPEQALAKRGVVDHRSDIYSLGVTLYELLSLQPAYTATDRQELLRQIAFEEPRKLRPLNPRIPQDLETIVLKAIEKNPADRYATSQELADDLRRFSHDRSIRARRPTLLQRGRKLFGRHRIAATVIAAIAFVSVVAATAVLADRHRQWQENNRFVETTLKAARAALESNNIEEALRRIGEAQSRVDAEQLVDLGLAKRVATVKSASERYAKFLTLYKSAREHRSDEGKHIAAAHEALALYNVKEDPRWFQTLNENNLPQAYADRVRNDCYELLLLVADDLIRWSSTWPKATREARLQQQCREAMEYLNTAIAFHPPSRGYYWLLANCSLIMGDREKEKRLRTTALETPPHDAAELFYINRDRVWGTVSHHRGYPAYASEEIYKDHREMLRLDPTYYNGMFFMAHRLTGESRYTEALISWYGCVAIRPDDYVAILNRGECHSRLGHFDEAKADFETALALGSHNPKLLNSVARYLATHPSEEMRDGKRAVELVLKACKLTDYQDAGVMTRSPAHTPKRATSSRPQNGRRWPWSFHKPIIARPMPSTWRAFAKATLGAKSKELGR
jgi:serine/threonine protein kinase